MKPEELRVGNWIADKAHNDVVFTVYGVTDYHVLIHPNEWEDIDNVQGIPITEEWLLKLGFEYGQSDDEEIGETGFIKRSTSGDGVFFKNEKLDGDYHLYYPYNDAPCWQVHQLQNLYFALTGEEL
jgi:hypothetical protein